MSICLTSISEAYRGRCKTLCDREKQIGRFGVNFSPKTVFPLNDLANISMQMVVNCVERLYPNFLTWLGPLRRHKSRGYAIAAQQIYGVPWQQGPGMDEPVNPSSTSCVYNAELVIKLTQLSYGLQGKIMSYSG